MDIIPPVIIHLKMKMLAQNALLIYIDDFDSGGFTGLIRSDGLDTLASLGCNGFLLSSGTVSSSLLQSVAENPYFRIPNFSSIRATESALGYLRKRGMRVCALIVAVR